MPRNTKKMQPIESDSDAGPTRMTTRAQNATVHPGNVLLQSLHARRSKKEVEEEKELKHAKKTAKEEKIAKAEALKAAGEAYVAQLEMKGAAAAANAEREVPCHRTGIQGMGSLLWSKCLVILDCSLGKANIPDKKKPAKRKASLDEEAVAPVRLLELYPYTTHYLFYQTQGEQGEQGDTDPETSPSPPAKKAKPNSGQVRPRPLRRNGRSFCFSCRTRCTTLD